MARTTTTGQIPVKRFITRYAKNPLPPDPDDLNHIIAGEINVVMKAFCLSSGRDRDSAALDMLVGLMHLCDRDMRFGDFDQLVAMAYDVYEESTEIR